MNALRGPLLDPERLQQRAAEIALEHGAPARRRIGSRLRSEWQRTARDLEATYAVVMREARQRRDSLPAEEWLLDNAHIVEEQVREIEEDLPSGYLSELPHIAAGPLRGYPHVHALCLDYLKHSDARIDPDTLVRWVRGYQTVRTLTIGELWAVPIMLRIGLVMLVASVATSVEGESRDVDASHAIEALLAQPFARVRKDLEKRDVSPAFLVDLWRALREGDASSEAFDWVRDRAAKLGTTPEELGRVVHLQRAEDQLSVANAITSMRTIGTYDWRTFFEKTSIVEETLAQDPVYAATDSSSRDRHRHEVERIARRSDRREEDVAQWVVELARGGHVGRWLEGDGRRELEKQCGARLGVHERFLRVVEGHPQATYFSLVLVLTTALVVGLAWAKIPAFLVALLAIPASDLALSIAGSVVVTLLPPRLLSRFAFDDGIPEEHRTLVVVPVLFDSIATVDRAIADLEIRALGNPDRNLSFALLGDFCDSDLERNPDDPVIVQRAIAGIARLNAKHRSDDGRPKYLLFHRRRIWDAKQGWWMGWERKRGKLEELNRLLRGAGDTTYSVVTAPAEFLATVRYVITLDADTELPRAAAIKLVATIAHPLNRPVFDSTERVISGYGLIQPRVGTLPSSSRRSRFARITSGPPGIDPYTSAVSDVYQDLFAEGSYIGKGIYDVDAFARALRGRVPPDTMLSHDLFEGIYARTALASDIELLDEQPSSYAVVARREHRWIRGDWQLVPFLASRMPLLGRWKIVDNLRRSLLGPSLVAALVSSVFFPRAAPIVVSFAVLASVAQLLVRFVIAVARDLRARTGEALGGLWGSLGTAAAQALLAFIVLFDRSLVALDAIGRTLFRILFTKRQLLEWQSTALDRSDALPVRLVVQGVLLLGFAAWAAWRGSVVAPMLGLWAVAPIVVSWVSRIERATDPLAKLGVEDRQAMRTVAEKTWHFFERFVTAEDNWLPPDNFQEEPRAVVAHRTSPTNIGLYLLSVLAARDFGWIDTRELVRRVTDTLDTLDRLAHTEGHILNWYDTRTLEPLEPRYVSTVDSGNLAAYLWTLARGCEELVGAKDADGELVDALREIAARAEAMVGRMRFGFLFDAQRSLFSIGYNVSTARLDTSHYDLLASEARLASIVAIAKGDIPEKHWFRMTRGRSRIGASSALLSWTGSMFEYVMPLLVTRSFAGTLLDATYAVAIEAHRQHGKRHGVPWGVSESAFNVMDLSMTYQYRAFGVQALGLKPGLDDDLVIAPYATALAALVRPDLAAANMRALEREGLGGEFGYYESIDYTPSRLPPGKRGIVVKAYMAHHQGMSLVALCNALLGSPMQRRFHSDPRIKATELLLEERVPATAPLVEHASHTPPAPQHGGELGLVETVALEPQELVRMHLLGNADLAMIASSSGSGMLTWRGLDVHRHREDGWLDASGILLYLRDRTTNAVWSAAFEPTRKTPSSSYRASFAVDHVEIHRRDADIEATTEIVISPEHPVEVRRLTLTNHGTEPHEIEVTTFTEVVLAPRAADVAHRAFSNMFVAMEALPELSAVLATRRPRTAIEHPPWMLQLLAPESEGWSAVEQCSSRATFLGRGRDVTRPRAMEGELGTTIEKHPLDPGIALRRRVLLAPGRTARISLVTALGAAREEVIALGQSHVGSSQIDRCFELAWADARVELKHLGIDAARSFRFQRLLSLVLHPHPSLRERESSLRGDARSALFGLGISGDFPLLAVVIDDGEVGELCRDLLVAHQFFRLNNVAIDLVFVNEEPAGYFQPVQDEMLALVRSSPAQAFLDQRGGVFVRRVDERERGLLLASARVVLRTSGGSLARQIRKPTATKRARAKPVAVERAKASALELRFDNGIGGFAVDGSYVVYGKPPAPWCNVLSNPSFGCLVSESGATFTWSENSQRRRLTPWSNDAVSDPSGEAIWIQTEDGASWLATEGIARHGVGESTFVGETNGIAHRLTIAVTAHAPVKTMTLRVENRTKEQKQLSIVGYVEWVLGPSRESTKSTVITDWDAERTAIFARNQANEWERTAFFSCSEPAVAHTAHRPKVFGSWSRRELGPVADFGPAMVGAGLDPCGALRTRIDLAPGEVRDLAFLVGEGRDRAEARELASSRPSIAHEPEVLHVDTPDPAIDLLVNHWLPHQILACRIQGRSAFYQSGGAFGFRDQLQDVLAVAWSRPDVARAHLLRAAARQFVDGDVQHWWHADSGEGVRTRCSDDMLWLAFATLEYIRMTGDRAVLDEEVPFLVERAIPDEQHDLFGTPRTSESTASLYEHCVRALAIGSTHGEHGLPLMRAGDWNDGMDRVGAGGRGESVWLAFFLATLLERFGALARARGDAARAEWCAAERAIYVEGLERHAWDGAWYRRGTFDDGSPLGSSTSTECRIDAIAQAWAVLSGVGAKARAQTALRSAEARLVSDDPPMMRLLDPPFDGRGRDPGYIRGYPPGIRENGGQYTHGVLWTVQALAKIGEAERAWSLLEKLNPIRHGADPAAIARYAVEPYVVAADVYSNIEHEGRGGWTWYTGAAGWMFRIVVESLLGLCIEDDRLSIAPCVPPTWKRYAMTVRRGNASYRIEVEHTGKDGALWLDGQRISDGNSVKLVDDGREHVVLVLPAESEEAPVPSRVRSQA